MGLFDRLAGLSARFACTIFTAAFLTAAHAANDLYEFDLVAFTGQTGISATGGTLTSIGTGPSINGWGEVAFQGGLSTGGNGLFANGLGFATFNLNPVFSINPSRTFSGAVQITNAHQVLARDQVSGAPPQSLIRFWELDAGSTFTTLVRGGNPGAPFDSVFAFPSANENREYVFSALSSSGIVLATPNGADFNAIALSNPLLPRMAFNGQIVVRAGGTTSFPIELFDNDLASSETISGGFSSVGRAPSSNDDGSIVVFAGDRGNGTGIFASVRVGGSRQLLRIAGEGFTNTSPTTAINVQFDPPDLGFDESISPKKPLFFSSIDLDGRVGIAHQVAGPPGLLGDSFVVVFIGTPNSASPAGTFIPGLTFTANKGIFAVRVDVIDQQGELGFDMSYVSRVVQVGDAFNIDGQVFSVTDLPSLYDPVANINSDDGVTSKTLFPGEHQIVFLAQTNVGQAVLRARQIQPCMFRVQRYSQGDPRWGSHTYDSSGQSISALGCAMTSLTMQSNLVMSQYLVPLGFDPDTMNSYMKTMKFFDASSGIKSVPTVASLNPLPAPPGFPTNNFKFKEKVRDTRVAGEATAAFDAVRDALCTFRAPIRVQVNFGTFQEKSRAGLTCFDTSHVLITTNGKACFDVAGNPILQVVRDKDGNPVIDTATGEPKLREDYHHHILATGQVNGKIFVADPGSSSKKRLDLDYPTGFKTRGYVVDPPDPSGTSIYFDEAVAVLVTRTDGKRTGFDIAAGVNRQEIPESSFASGGISDPVTDPPPLTVMNEINLFTPAEGTYELKIVEVLPVDYSVEISVVGRDGTIQPEILFQDTGIPGRVRTLNLNLSLAPGAPPSTITPGGASVTVPNVVGLTQAAATTAITGAGLVLGTVTTQPSATVPAGNVISQDPAAGASVATGTSVALVVSSGPAPVTVPNLVGLTQAAATTAITGAGLVLGTVTTQPSATVPAGNVISQDPAAGASVATGTSVALVVSSGPAPVTVPNVVGLTQAAATTAITGAGLVLGTVTTQPSATVPAGNVISQNPLAGASVAPGSAVALIVSSGPAPVTVPNVVGLTQAAATTAITGAGLVLGTVTTQPSATVPAGNVISQNPLAGASAARGSAVALVVSSGPAAPTVPSVVGQTQAAAQAAITSAGYAIGTLVVRASTTVAPGTVIAQSPTAGTAAALGTKVDLVISMGTEITAAFNVTRSGLLLNRSTNTFDLTVTMSLKSGTFHGPLFLVVDTLTPSTVTLANAQGSNDSGKPMISVAVPAAGLKAAQHVTQVLKFANPGRVAFSWTSSVHGTPPSP